MSVSTPAHGDLSGRQDRERTFAGTEDVVLTGQGTDTGTESGTGTGTGTTLHLGLGEGWP